MNKKIVVGIVVLILGSVGVWFIWRGKQKPSPIALAQKAVGTHYAGGGSHVIEGTVTLPNPCYTLMVTAEKKGGSPEQVLLQFSAQQTADACVQVEHDAPFRVSFEAADDAVLSAVINEVPMALELERKLRVSVDAGEEFIIAQSEDRWVEDLKITFLGVEDDNRCPVDVQCIQAGWVTARFQAGTEEILLRLPGDASIPNAAVAGSYIITVVDIAPHPKSTEPIKQYTATLRIEIYDLKG